MSVAATTTPLTPLMSSITIPWRREFRRGCGLNAVTGTVSESSAFKDISGLPSCQRTGNQVTNIRIVHSANTLREELGFSVGASLNLVPLDASVGAVAAFKSYACVSATSISLLVTYTSDTWEEDVPASQFELTEEAKELARTNPDAFRNTYGDYFISSVRSGSTFTAIATCTFSDTEQRSEIVGILSLAAGNALDIHAAVATDKALSSRRVDTLVHIRHAGLAKNAYSEPSEEQPPLLSRTYQSFAEIVRILDWFQRHQDPYGQPVEAVLRHYSAASGISDQVIPRSLPIPYDVFRTVEKLRDTIVDCLLYCNSLIGYISDREITPILKMRGHDLASQVEMYKERLVTDEACRASLLDQARELETELIHFHEVHACFIKLLHEDVVAQPGPNRQIVGQRFGYGLNPDHSKPGLLVERGETIEIRLGRAQFGDVIGYLPRPTGGHIVGWTVTAHHDRRTSWRQLTSSVILAPEGGITCRREHAWRTWFMPCKWTFTVFVVRENKVLDLFYRYSEFKNKADITTLVTAPIKANRIVA